MRTLSSTLRAAVVCAYVVGSPWAAAAPVVQQGSSYSLSLHQVSAIGSPTSSTLTFDGVAETFIFTPVSGVPVTVTTQESQVDLGGGRASIDITLDFAGGDPYPGTTFSGIGLGWVNGSVAGDALDLTGPVGLSAAVLRGVAGDGSPLLNDALPDYQMLGINSPWNGALLGLAPPVFGTGLVNYLLDVQWGGVGLRQMTLHFETQAPNSVSSPGTAPLLAVSLCLLALVARRQRA